jgi:hypothetical protein
MAKVLRACVIAKADGNNDPLGGAVNEAQRKSAEANPRNPRCTLGNQVTVLAGGEPKTFGAPPASLRSDYLTAASAMDIASRAPSSKA